MSLAGDIHTAATQLYRDYNQLDQLKYQHQVREARVMRARPGPQPPANLHHINAYIQLETNLREVAYNALGDIRIHLNRELTAPQLCRAIAALADTIATLDWAHDLLDELRGQHQQITTLINPQPDHVLAAIEKRKAHLLAKYQPTT